MSDSPLSSGKLIIISGPSGTGKGTIIRELMKSGEFPFVLSVSATTRFPRAGEKDGVDYYFLTREEFQRKREANQFLESMEVYPGGDWYGTPADGVEKFLRQGKWVVLEIDVKGAACVLEKCPDALTFFILSPDLETLRNRLVHRGSETPAAVEKRLAQAEAEIKESSHYRFRIVNNRLEDAVNDFRKILRDEMGKVA